VARPKRTPRIATAFKDGARTTRGRIVNPDSERLAESLKSSVHCPAAAPRCRRVGGLTIACEAGMRARSAPRGIDGWVVRAPEVSYLSLDAIPPAHAPATDG
jgi:hypothetical protein